MIPVHVILTIGMEIGFFLETIAMFYLIKAFKQNQELKKKNLEAKSFIFLLPGVILQFLEEIYESFKLVMAGGGPIVIGDPEAAKSYLLSAFLFILFLLIIIEVIIPRLRKQKSKRKKN